MHDKLLNFISQLQLESSKKEELIALIQETARFPVNEATVAIQHPDLAVETQRIPRSTSVDATLTMAVPSELLETPSTQDVQAQIGKYPITKLLGTGGYGEVYRVHDPDLNRDVALKVLKVEHSARQSEIKRFMREAQICAQLQHPGIVAIYEIKRDKLERPYFTMFEIEGENLQAIIKKLHVASYQKDQWATTDDGWSFKKVIHTVIKVCETLAYAHSRGVIHRDIKPANIMIGNFGEVSIVDWGIAKCTVDSAIIMKDYIKEECPNSIIGTPKFMSPEQASGRADDIDARSDIYSVGVILYFLLMGRSIYQGSVSSIVENITSPQFSPSFPSPLPERIPQALTTITLRALAHKPENRFQSALDLARELEVWLEGSQKQERAQQLLQEIESIEEQEQALHSVLMKEYATLQQLFQSKSITPQIWGRWESYNQQKVTLQAYEHQKEQCMLNALIYAPYMQVIHKQILEIEFGRYKRAWLQGDIDTREQIEKKIAIHLQHLPPEEIQRWEEFKTRQNDTINHLRREEGGYIGSHSFVDEALQSLSTKPYIVLAGQVGIGKTRLALEIAAAWRDTYLVDAYFCNLQLCTTLSEAYHVIVSTLGISTAESDDLAELTKGLQNRSGILIFDSIDSIGEDTSAMFDAMQNFGDNIKCIVTTQNKRQIDSQYLTEQTSLSTLASLELFLKKANSNNPNLSFLKENRHDYLDIVQCLEGIPLAIELIAARLSVLSLQELHARTQSPSFTSQGTGLTKILQWSWLLLSKETQSILLQCTLFRDGFYLEAALAICSPGQDNLAFTIGQLDTLIQAQFLQKKSVHGKTRYYLLPAVARFLQEHVDELAVTAKQRFGHYYAQKYTPSYQKENNDTYWRERLLEQRNLITAISYGTTNDAQKCVAIVLELLYFRYDYRLALHVISSFMAKIPNKYRRSHYLYAERFYLSHKLHQVVLLQTYSEQLDYNQANEQEPIFYAHWYRSLGAREEQIESFSNAISYYKKALVLFRRQQKLHLVIDLLIILGSLHRRTSDLGGALEYSLEAQKIAQREGATHFFGRILMQLGVLYKMKADFQTALLYYQKAYRHMQTFANEDHLARVLANIANIYRRQGLLRKSLKVCYQSLRIYHRLGNTFGIINVQNSIGLAYLVNGHYEQAIGALQKSYDLARRMNKKYHLATIAGNLGNVYRARKEYKLALEKQLEANRILQEMNRKKSLAVSASNIGETYMCLGEFVTAQRYLDLAWSNQQDIEPSACGYLYGIQGQLHSHYKDFDKAEKCFAEGELMLTNSTTELIKFLERKVRFYHTKKDTRKQKEIMQRMHGLIESLEEETRVYMHSRLDKLTYELSQQP